MKGPAVSALVVGACAWPFCLKAGAESIPQMVARAKQAIIEVRALNAQGKVLGTGTAFFIRNDGTAVTNAHVIQGASSLVGVSNTGAEYRFERVVGRPPDIDLAILKFSAIDVPYLTLSSSRAAMEGQRVLVIGNPQGLQGTVSDGLISAFRMDHALIQITAPISPGSSGSPVLNEDGQVIGVAFLQLVNGQNLNFAIASEEVEKAERLANADGSTRLPAEVAVATPTPSPSVGSAPSGFTLEIPETPQQREARLRYQEAAEAGDTAAMVNLGILYENGRGVAQDFAKAREWFQKAADAGNAEGMLNLGQLYQIFSDDTRASDWYRKAATAGNTTAMNRLGDMYFAGWLSQDCVNGYPRDYARQYALAQEWYQKAIAVGSVEAMDKLAYLYQNGWAVTPGGHQNLAKGRYWYQKAAAAGNTDAMTSLGAMYQEGWGVAQDYAKARQWYEKAAAVGDPLGMRSLGELYETGRGVPRDYERARQLYEKAGYPGWKADPGN